jgi:hypothetical protein
MPLPRIKGQETDTVIVVQGSPLLTVKDIRNFEITIRTEKLEEGYLGETSNRFDEILKGIDFRGEFHFENQDILTIFAQAVHDRAVRRNPATKINIRTTLNFPGGDRPRISLKDCFFGPIPMNIAERSQYVAVTVEGSCSDVSILPG